VLIMHKIVTSAHKLLQVGILTTIKIQFIELSELLNVKRRRTREDTSSELMSKGSIKLLCGH
jgi:hypothetical protein